MKLNLADVVQSAKEHQLTFDSRQQRLSQTFIKPILKRLHDRCSEIRAEIDREFALLTKDRTCKAPSAYGESNPSQYPLGYCDWIRNRAWEQLSQDPFIISLRKRGLLWNQVFFIGRSSFFQNAIQLGDYVLDVANNALNIGNPPVDCYSLSEQPIENLDTWLRYADVAPIYYKIELYPNRYFPMLFPLVPFLAVRSNGRLELSYQQQMLFLMDVGENWKRLHELVQSDLWRTRKLPLECEERLSRLQDFPFEYKPLDDDALLASLRDWNQLRALKPKQLEQTLSQLDQLAHVAAQTLRNAQLEIAKA